MTAMDRAINLCFMPVSELPPDVIEFVKQATRGKLVDGNMILEAYQEYAEEEFNNEHNDSNTTV